MDMKGWGPVAEARVIFLAFSVLSSFSNHLVSQFKFKRNFALFTLALLIACSFSFVVTNNVYKVRNTCNLLATVSPASPKYSH